MTLIYDENGQLLWAQRDVPWLMKMIQPDWLKSNGFHEIEADVNDTSLLLSGDLRYSNSCRKCGKMMTTRR